MSQCFGSTVWYRWLVGLNPGIALFSSGVGTLQVHLDYEEANSSVHGSLVSPSSFRWWLCRRPLGYPGVATGVISVGIVYLWQPSLP